MQEKKENFRFSNREEYLVALDSVMPMEYVQTRDLPTGKQLYLPIPIQESIADDIFHYWNVTDEKYIVIANELVCTVRITYMPSYPGADELFCTGSASKAIQMDAKAKVSDFPALKKSNALEYCLPASRSAAIGCALNSLGNLFGRNLGRKISNDKHLANDFKIRNIQAETK